MLMGGQQNLFLKSLAELVSETFDGNNQFVEWSVHRTAHDQITTAPYRLLLLRYTYVVIVAVATLAAAQVVTLNMGESR